MHHSTFQHNFHKHKQPCSAFGRGRVSIVKAMTAHSSMYSNSVWIT